MRRLIHIENPWVTGHGPWDEPEPEVLEQCAECGFELRDGDTVYEIGDGEKYYCTDCLTADVLEKRTKCTCCDDILEKGEKIFKTTGGAVFCTYCVSEVTLDIDEPDWDSMPGGHDDI